MCLLLTARLLAAGLSPFRHWSNKMKSVLRYSTAVVCGLIATTGSALAVPVVPEPQSFALVGLGLGLAYLFGRKKK